MEGSRCYDFEFVSWFPDHNSSRTKAEIDQQRFIVSSLCALCCEKLVSNAAYLNDVVHAGNRVPAPLQTRLIETAIKRCTPDSFMYILNIFQRQSFRMVLPPSLRNWEMFSAMCKRENVPSTAYLVPILLKLLMHALYDHRKHRTLKMLDFSEIPLDWNDFSFFFRMVKSFEGDNCERKPHGQQQRNGTAHRCCVSRNGLTIVMNLVVSDEFPIYVLREVLNASKEGVLRMRFLLSGLHLIGECPETFLTLLELVDSEYLRIFTASNCFFNDAMHPRMFEFIKTFRKLNSLDLSSGYCSYQYVSLIADALGELNELKRLELQNNDLSDCLDTLLSKIQPGSLEQLNVRFCCLKKKDILFLGSSHFSENLKCLEIGFNYLDLECLTSLITGCKNLQILLMKQCEFRDKLATADAILGILSKSQKLRYLNIGCIEKISSEDVLRNAECIGQMSNLRLVCVSYANTKGIPLENEADKNRARDEFGRELEALIRATGQNPTRTIKVHCYFSLLHLF